MFRWAAKIFTLISVIFHAGVGCCAHHDHFTPLDTASSAVELQVPHSHSCTSHSHIGAEATSKNVGGEQPIPNSCPCGEGDESCTDDCSWLTNSRVEMPADAGIEFPAVIPDIWAFRTSSAALLASNFSDGPPLLSDSTDSLRAKSQVWRL